MDIFHRITKLKPVVSHALLLILLSGCSPYEPLIEKPRPLDSANVALAEAVEASSEALTNLQAIKLKQEPTFILDKPADHPTCYGLGRMASVDWSGPIEPLLETIGALTDYRVKMVGKKPALPILVSISKNNVLVGDIIRSARLQAGERAKVVVYPKDKLIELRYLSA